MALTRRDVADDVVTLTIDRPEKRNALSKETLDELAAHLDELAAEPIHKALVVTGEGETHFASGGDLVELSALRTEAEAEAMARRVRGVLDRIRAHPVPTVAALNGDALGGGAELALAFDFRVAASHARIGYIQGRQAITSAWGGGPDLIDRVGPSTALRLMTTTELLDAHAAERLGLVDHVAHTGHSVTEATAEWLAPMLERQVQVLRTYKALTAAARAGAHRDELESIELAHFTTNWVHPDHWDALDAFLHRKR
ncbi:MAG: enoyl-CoA hydratase/isomerase family protein [Acidimicrobiia bacterium]